MRRRPWLLLGVVAALFACGDAPAQAVKRGKNPCKYVDARKCKTTAATTPALLSLFEGGVPSAAVATGSALTTATGAAITSTRSSTTLCQKTDLTLTSLTSNAPCVEPKGLRVQASSQQIVSRSDNLASASWTTTSATVAMNATGPDGDANGAATLTASAGSSQHFLAESVATHGSGAGLYSIAFKAKPGTANFVRVVLGAQGFDLTLDLANKRVATTNSPPSLQFNSKIQFIETFPAGNGFTLYVANELDNTGSGNLQFYPGDTVAHTNSVWTAAGTESVIIAQPMMGFYQDPRPYFPNSGTTTLTRAADTHTVANPLQNSDASYCVRVRGVPDNNNWNQGSARGLFQLGTTAGAANTASLSVSSAGLLVWSVVDSTGAAKTCTSTTSIWSGARVIRACNTAGTLSASMDGKALTCTTTGTGTGQITTQPGTAYLGSLGTGTQFGGVLSDLCLDRGAGSSSCPATPALRPTYVARTIATVGDSLTGPGPVDTTFWPTVFAAAVPTWSVTNYGAGNLESADYYVNLQGTVLATHPQVITVEGGINDSIFVSNDMAFVYPRLYDEIDASGAEAVVLIESPWANSASWTAGAQTKYDAQRTALTNWCTSTGHRCVNFYTGVFNDGNTPAGLACAYDYGGCGAPNKVHLNNLAHQVKAAAVQSVLGL